MVTTLRRRACEEGGFSMVTVILLGSLAMLLAATMAARSFSNANQVTDARQDEQALHVADSAIDDTLHELTESSGYTTSAFDNSESMPTFTSVAQEEAWVRAEAAASTNLVTVGGGQWVAIKPPNSPVLYAVGYVPSRSEARQTRIIRVEHDFASSAFDTALLSAGNISISGSPTIGGTRGNVHTNGSVTQIGGTFSGYVAAVGTVPSGTTSRTGDDANTGGGRPTRPVPEINPRAHYALADYVLCPNGTVRAGPAYQGTEAKADATVAPCTSGTSGGATLATATGSEYRGWKRSGTESDGAGKWDYSGNTAYQGTYYLFQGNANVSGNPGSSSTPWEVTILAEAEASAIHSPTSCSGHIGGDIMVSGNPTITAASRSWPIALLAGRDLGLSGNPGTPGREGFYGAHEQIKFSGNPTVYGAIVINDACDVGQQAKRSDTTISGNPTIIYNGTFENPFASNVRITRWQEL